eukprot:CAMPEP_0118851880 /NCGR_PEP_ID=MMETSP1163-20130328/1143_1 /TAXON_ID=124430 /ORGANISM="Phaeomonas parva, Strain CCMP2877" /LENGTH=78 /DNA_ID=CAMNT_0006784271 /DNA_START=605 /DNA_END=838 /DNA_ORIENTATION=+
MGFGLGPGHLRELLLELGRRQADDAAAGDVPPQEARVRGDPPLVVLLGPILLRLRRPLLQERDGVGVALDAGQHQRRL